MILSTTFAWLVGVCRNNRAGIIVTLAHNHVLVWVIRTYVYVLDYHAWATKIKVGSVAIVCLINKITFYTFWINKTRLVVFG